MNYPSPSIKKLKIHRANFFSPPIPYLSFLFSLPSLDLPKAPKCGCKICPSTVHRHSASSALELPPCRSLPSPSPPAYQSRPLRRPLSPPLSAGAVPVPPHRGVASPLASLDPTARSAGHWFLRYESLCYPGIS
jgi:hypothetical protein